VKDSVRIEYKDKDVSGIFKINKEYCSKTAVKELEDGHIVGMKAKYAFATGDKNIRLMTTFMPKAGKFNFNLNTDVNFVSNASKTFGFENIVMRYMFANTKKTMQMGFMWQKEKTDKEASNLTFQAIFQPCGHFNAWGRTDYTN
jgi:hypothetical protein